MFRARRALAVVAYVSQDSRCFECAMLRRRDPEDRHGERYREADLVH